MSYQVHVTGIESERSLVAPARQACARTLEYVESPPGNIGVVLTDDQEVQELNRDFRSLDEPTDVLSFQMDERDPETGELYFGDIVISIPTARSQAQIAGHSLITELSLLVVHGTLHLLGFDHGNPVDQKRMWEIQTAILQSLGMDPSLPEQEH